MNIKDAKQQIKNAMTAYFTKDKNGEYIVPAEKQRPVFLMGPPGIGKTAVMEQIASEMGVGLLSYSMTHHTRQSALGLPFIEHRKYKGLEYDISEYTMSEIIASVYELMEASGVEEGILFLDEINCVSETLAPVMLQFLQYKVFGRHKVPDGWIVVTAGNPPEYNKSVREFDVATWDRLKRIDVEPDFETWKEYAYKKAVHPAVLTYLEIRSCDFYKIETTVDGKSFVTARGWEDLSRMLQLYELHGIEADEKLTSQYIQDKAISKNFAVYYDLFNKYKSDYQVADILAGKAKAGIKRRAGAAKFDERLSLTGLLLDEVFSRVRAVMDGGAVLDELLVQLKELRGRLAADGSAAASDIVLELIEKMQNRIASSQAANNASREETARLRETLAALDNVLGLTAGESDPRRAFKAVKDNYEKRIDTLTKDAGKVKTALSQMFKFIEEVYGEGQEMLIVVTELTANVYTARFIAEYGCDEYYRHNKELLFYERRKELLIMLDELDDLDDTDGK